MQLNKSMQVELDGRLVERPVSHYEEFPSLGGIKLPVPTYDRLNEFVAHRPGNPIPVIISMDRTKKTDISPSRATVKRNYRHTR